MQTNTMPQITASMTLNEIVERYPASLPTLRRLGFDTCCGGAVPLQEAAHRHHLALEWLLHTLRAAVEEQP